MTTGTEALVAPDALRVSIVIPAYNEASIIDRCVRAALAQTVPAHEIIVVDNRSTDDTAGIVRSLQAEHPDTPIILLSQDAEQGLIPTRDLGLDAASGDVLGRIDADTLPEPAWVAAVQRTFTDPEIAAATGPVLYYDMPLQRFGQRADDVVRRALAKVTRDFHLLFGSNMALRASTWRAIRGEVCRDAEDEMHEDIDISVHLHQRRMPIAYSSDMVAGMSARRLDDSPRDFYSYVMRFERTYRAHGVRGIAVRAPMAIFLSVYPAAKALRGTARRTART